MPPRLRLGFALLLALALAPLVGNTLPPMPATLGGMTGAILHEVIIGLMLGTLMLPYCSGLGNLLFVLLILRDGGDRGEVVVNALLNNVTNLTLLLGLPALIWGLVLIPRATAKKAGSARRSRNGQLDNSSADCRSC